MESQQQHTTQRCAQEILDGLQDRTNEITKITGDINNVRSTYNFSDGEAHIAHMVKGDPDEDHEFPFKDDPLRTVLGLFKSDTFDRTSLAVSKVIARYDVGETTMTVSEMEHRRKLTPKFIAFLQSYIKILVEAETEEANAIELTKKDAEAMAREALASLGSAKGASDAAAFVKSVVAGHMRDNQFNLVKQCERSVAEGLLEELEEQLALLESARTNANSTSVEPFNMPPPLACPIGSTPDGPSKTVQEILCAASPGPASLYSKMDKLSQGLRTSHSPNVGPGTYVIAGVNGPGRRKVELYNKDVIQRYREWFELLIRYQVALDRLNLEVTFIGGDEMTWMMQWELIRQSQTIHFSPFLSACESQLRDVKKAVSDCNRNVDDYVRTKKMNLSSSHERTNLEAAKVKKRQPSTEDEDDVARQARIQLETAHVTMRLQRQAKEKDALEKEVLSYRKSNTAHLTTVPDLEECLIDLRKTHDANSKVNRRRRAPANAQRSVLCSSLNNL